MTSQKTDELIDRLVASAPPVRPLASPLRRSLIALGVTGGCGALAVIAFGNIAGQIERYRGQELLMALEFAAMIATAVIALVGAFFVSIPGRSKRWLAAPLAPLVLWVGLSGAGCMGVFGGPDLVGAPVEGLRCLYFILGSSLLIGGPLFWLLARARPVDPLPPALLGGLGAAALSAVLLQFFHPFALTLIDLALHLLAVLIIVSAAAFSRRATLRPG